MAIKNVQLLGANDYERVPMERRNEYYGELVERLIRKKYTVSAELAILRQRDDKPQEFAEYNAYAEQCKAEAKNKLGVL